MCKQQKPAQTMEKLRLIKKKKKDTTGWNANDVDKALDFILVKSRDPFWFCELKDIERKCFHWSSWFETGTTKESKCWQGKIGHENLYSLKHPSPNGKELPWDKAHLWAGHLINTQVVVKKWVPINNSSKYIHTKGTLSFNTFHTLQLLCAVGKKKKNN